jgi:hypothetical protein
MKRMGLLIVLFLVISAGFSRAQESIDPNAEPNFATLTLGGSDNYWLDPTLVSVVGGVLEGASTTAEGLGDGCIGVIPVAPDVVVNWEEDTSIEHLRIFFVGDGDSTMVIVTPDGSVLCNDDLNPLALNPMIEIANPVSGRYAIFMGSFAENAIEPGLLVFTSSALTPLNFDITALVPSPADSSTATESLPASVLLVSTPPTNPEAAVELTAGFDTHTQAITVSGSLPAFNIELGSNLCTGFVDPVPTFTFTWMGESEALRVFFEGDQDSTLIVLGPDGAVNCNDDLAGASNLNPSVDVTPVEGQYVIYVGSFAPGGSITGTLTITESTDNIPTALTSADLPE